MSPFHPVALDGLGTRVQRPRSWANQQVLDDAKRHTHTAQGLAVPTIWGDLLWCDGGWRGSCHEQELVRLSGQFKVLDTSGVATIIDRGFRGTAKPRELWWARVGDRRTKDRLSDQQRAFNRLQAGLRALVEQSIGHLANAWACAAGGGCCTASGTSSGLLARSSAWAGGCTGCPREIASRTPSMPWIGA